MDTILITGGLIIIVLLIIIGVLIFSSYRKIDDVLYEQEKLSSNSLPDAQNMAVMASALSNMSEQLGKLDVVEHTAMLTKEGMDSLNKKLSNNSDRGKLGEALLYNTLDAVFGQNSRLYETQYTLSNGKIADAIVRAARPLGMIAIDSKFPMNNFERILNASTKAQANSASKAFDKDMRKHIDDIADKYIVSGETANSAIMFVPSEAIFSEIYCNHENIVSYAYKRNVWITGPTTMMAVLTNILMVCKNIKTNERIESMKDEIDKLGALFDKYDERWKQAEKHAEALSSDIHDLCNTSNKISRAFRKIRNE